MTGLKALFAENAAKFATSHQLIGQASFEQIWSALTPGDLNIIAEGLEKKRWVFKDKLLHSDRDPYREADRAAESLKNARAVIAVSVGVGFILGRLKPAVQEIFIIEPTPCVLAAFICTGEFLKYHGKITVFADNLLRADALEEILPWLQGKNLRFTLIYCHPPFAAIDKAAATRAVERIEALFEKRSVNQATIVKFQQLWNKNILLNQRAVAAAKPMRAIWGLSPPQALVLAGAGPSLSHSFAELKSLRKKFVLFAADTAFIPLVKAGITPDFVFSADPQWLNHFFCQSAKAGDTAWVMDPVVHPAIPRQVQRSGAATYFWNNVFLSDAYFRTVDRGDVAHGGSVSTNAFDMALNWLLSGLAGEASRRLILTGQDLSFSNKQAHTPGAVLEAQIFARSTKLITMERHNFRQMTAMPVITVKGIRQPAVRTNGKLKIFLDWFAARAAECDKSKVRLINATYDGARIQGFEHLTLGEALAGVTDFSMPASLPQQEMRPMANEKAKKLQVDLRTVFSLMRENTILSAEKNPGPGTLDKLNRNDEKLKALVPAKDIVALNAQALILRITEQGEAAAPAEFYGAMARAARELLHWLAKIG